MTKDQRPNQYYNLVDPKTGKVYPPDPNRVWAYYPETMQQKIEEELIIFPEDTSQRPKLKRFKKDLKSSTNPISAWIDTKTNDEQDDVVALLSRKVSPFEGQNGTPADDRRPSLRVCGAAPGRAAHTSTGTQTAAVVQ